ncbi:MAG: restriction endonuclease [Deltaproteobacteria bacterium]|nr:restriction endonuclease [Deltaproteobacteria bacterium]
MGKVVDLRTKLAHLVLTILKENNGQMRGRELVDKAAHRIELDDWAKSQYEKSGNLKWRSICQFSTIGLVKAGFLVKKKAIWYLTEEGAKALSKTPQELKDEVDARYRQWAESQPKDEDDDNEEPETQDEHAVRATSFEDLEAQSIDVLNNYISNKNPYEFQDLVAALLRGMGYYTPFIAPKGKDGGMDIIAYRDPLGTQTPRILVQVKHRQNTCPVQPVRELQGLLINRPGDVGIFVSSGGFTSDATAEAKKSHVHIELIDLDRFISLWLDFYPKMTEEDKALLPLRTLYVLAPEE